MLAAGIGREGIAVANDVAFAAAGVDAYAKSLEDGIPEDVGLVGRDGVGDGPCCECHVKPVGERECIVRVTIR